MHTLLQFLGRSYPLFLFIFLELVCLVLMINHHHYQRVSYLHGANAFNGYIDEKISGWGEFLLLRESNEQLLAYNETLLSEVYRTDNFTDINSKEAVTDTLCDPKNNAPYIFHSAKVINRTVNRQHNYLTINKGSNDGIKAEMGVISNEGLVGIVKNVSANYATVMTLIHKESKISALLSTTKNFGSLRWNGKSALMAQLYDIPSYVPIPMNDTLVTSGFSAIFPEGIPIGIVKEKSISKGDSFYVLDIKLLTDFHTLYNVYIIEYTDLEERLQLEASTIKGLGE